MAGKLIIFVILYLGLVYIGLLITYFVIKTAIKHAIRESSDYIQKIIADAISQSKDGKASNC